MDKELNIQRVTESDASELLAIYAPYVAETAISFETVVPSLEAFQERIRGISAQYPYIKAVRNHEIVGYAYAGTFKARKAYNWSAEVTVYVKDTERGKGIGTALYTALELALRSMGILNMNACIAVPKQEDPHLTDASRQFHEAMGFQLVGTFHDSGYKFDTWYNMIWMEKHIGEHKTHQPDVTFGIWNIEQQK